MATIVIIGSGLAGSLVASRLAARHQVIVIEQSRRNEPLRVVDRGRAAALDPHVAAGLGGTTQYWHNGLIELEESDYAAWPLAAAEVDVRRRNAARLLAALQQQAAFETISPLPRARPGYLRLPTLASPEIRGTTAAARLGVFPSYPRALCDLPGFTARCVNRRGAFPGARLLAARLSTLPTHSRLDDRDLARLEGWIRSAGR